MLEPNTTSTYQDLEQTIEGGLDFQSTDHPAIEPVLLAVGSTVQFRGSLAGSLPYGSSSKGVIRKVSKGFPFFIEATVLKARAMTPDDVFHVTLGPLDPLQQHRDMGGFICVQPYRPRDRREANLLFNIRASSQTDAVKTAAEKGLYVADRIEQDYVSRWAKNGSVKRATLSIDKPGFIRLSWNAPKGIPSSMVLSVTAADEVRRSVWMTGPKGAKCRFAGPDSLEFDYNGVQFEIQADRQQALGVMEKMQQPSPIVS